MKLISIKKNAVLVLATLIALLAVPAAPAFAATFNTHPSDCPTVMVARENEEPSTICWTRTVEARDNQVVVFAVYYHNTGTQPEAVTVSMSTPSTTYSNSKTVDGYVKINGANVTPPGFATVWFKDSQGNPTTGYLTPISASKEWMNEVDKTPISYSSVLGSGYTTSPVQTSGTYQQGTVKVAFRVEAKDNVVVPTARPDAETLPETNLGSDTATIEGRANPNGVATEAWFIYGKGNLNSSTNEVSVGSGTSFVPFDHTLSNLSAGTYEYQACARHINTFAQDCGATEYFTIGSVNPGDNLVVETRNPDVDEDNAEAELKGEVVTLGDNANSADVWIEWGEGDSVSDLDHTIDGNDIDPDDTVNSDGEDFSATIDNLEDGQEYVYRACAENDNGDTDCGSIETFTFNDNGGDELAVTTDSATNIDDDRATLHGEIEAGDSDVDTCWFEYGTDNDINDLDDTKNFSCSINNNDTEDVSATITGLQDDEKYYFRLCAEDEDGNEDCGSIKSFTTDDEVVVDDHDLPTIQTLSVLAFGSTYASVDGYYDANGCSVSTWFEYGTSTGLGNRTISVNQGNGYGSMAQFVSGLSSNTTYYYRAAGQNCEGSAYGSILTFKTGTVYVPPPVVVTSGGGGSSFIKLMITNNEDTVSAGENLEYEVSWKNISGRTLTNLVLEVEFPKGLRVLDIDDGDFERDNNAVIIEIDSLAPGEEGETEIETCVRRFRFSDGDPVTVRAIMAFENPATGATLQAIAYDSDEFEGSMGFMPASLLGWLLIILLIIIIILIVRSLLKKKDGNPSVGGPTSGEYVPYHPTPRT